MNPISTFIKHDGAQYITTGTRSPIGWDFTQCITVVTYRPFGTTYSSQLQGSSNPNSILFGLHDLKDGIDGFSRNVGTISFYAA
jgi:hypothetical protein